MNYKLAKQLKEAGFKTNSYEPLKTIVQPTLSELIEACGGKAKMLLDKGDGNGWVYAVDGVSAGGETPKEAVAKLFIELNKKT